MTTEQENLEMAQQQINAEDQANVEEWFSYAEVINGRAAMLGFFGVLGLEQYFGVPFLDLFNAFFYGS